MTYSFRLRFLAHGPRLGTDGGAIEFQLTDGQVVSLAPARDSDSPLHATNDLRIRGGGFATAGEARGCGERMRAAIRTSSAHLPMAFDLGRDSGGTHTSDAIKEEYRKRGFRAVDNVHGLQVYEEDLPAKVISVEGSGYSSIALAMVIEAWKRQYELNPSLSPREVLAFELYAFAHREPFQRARFLTLISVVEVLAVRAKRSGAAIALIDGFIEEARKALHGPDLKSLMDSLQNLKSESIRGACRKYVEAALTVADWHELDDLYSLRSTIAHDGDVPAGVELGDRAHQLDGIVARLLARLGVAH